MERAEDTQKGIWFCAAIALSILLAGCGGGGGGSSSGDGGFGFVVPAAVVDPVFRACLENQAIEESWRSNSDVRSITCPRQDSVSDYGAGAASLAGVQAFSNLEEIFVEGAGTYALGQLEDLTPLRGLTRLHTIEVYSTALRSLDSIRGMRSLRHLTVSPSILGNLDALPTLTGLRYLEISGFNTHGLPIEDFSPISQLSNLEELHVAGYEPVRDYGLGFLQGLSNLTVLNISENLLTDLNGLQYVSGIESIDLSYNLALTFSLAAQNEQIIAGLTNLRELRFAAFDGNSLGFLSGMSRIETLTVTRYYGLSAADLTLINTLSSIKELYLEGFANADVSLLQGMSNLELLWLANGTVDSTTLAFPATLTSLRELHMYDAFHYHYLFGDRRGDFKNSYDVFADLPNLRELYLLQPWLVNPSTVVLNPNLQSISMNAAYLDDLTFFQDVNGIQSLDLSDNPFTELDALTLMPDLSVLVLNETMVNCDELEEFLAAAASVQVTTDLICP